MAKNGNVPGPRARVSNPRLKATRTIGGSAGDKMSRAATELRESSAEMEEAADSVSEGAERLNTVETVVRLRGHRVGSLIEKVAALDKEVVRLGALIEKFATDVKGLRSKFNGKKSA